MSVLLNRALQQNLWPVPKDNQYFVMYQSIFVYDTVLNKRNSFKHTEKYSIGWRYWSSLDIYTGDWVTLVLQSKLYQYIDIPSSILNIIPVNVHLLRKSQNSQNRRHYLHRKYRSDLPKVKIWHYYAACIFLNVWVLTNAFSYFYIPTLAVFRKISDRLRLSQNFEKRDFIMFLLTVLVSKPPNRTYSNCHFIKDFEENYLVLQFLWLSRMHLMLVKRWFVFVKCVRHNDGAKLT